MAQTAAQVFFKATPWCARLFFSLLFCAGAIPNGLVSTQVQCESLSSLSRMGTVRPRWGPSPRGPVAANTLRPPGLVPVNLLFSSSRCLMSVNSPITSGIAPVRLFCSNAIDSMWSPLQYTAASAPWPTPLPPWHAQGSILFPLQAFHCEPFVWSKNACHAVHWAGASSWGEGGACGQATGDSNRVDNKHLHTQPSCTLRNL